MAWYLVKRSDNFTLLYLTYFTDSLHMDPVPHLEIIKVK
jgi:hypothetical protein